MSADPRETDAFFQGLDAKLEAKLEGLRKEEEARRQAELEEEDRELEEEEAEIAAEEEERFQRQLAALDKAHERLEAATAGGVDTLWQAGWELGEIPELHGVPLWQALSGLTPMMQLAITPGERLLRVRKFMAAVERMIRFEMEKNFQEHSSLQPQPLRGGMDTFKEHREKKEKKRRPDGELSIIDNCSIPRSTSWDPLSSICFYLGITLNKLNALAKEVQGMTLVQLVDIVRMERAKVLLEMDLRLVAGEWLLMNREAIKQDATELARQVAVVIKRMRRAPLWDRTLWAMGLGFSSYAKFFRACAVCESKKPTELELALLEQIFKELKEVLVSGGPENSSRKDAKAQRTEERKEGEGDNSGAAALGHVFAPDRGPTASGGTPA
ncbi:MAG TPA: hypothetical protein VEK08_24830 [Planctomycetota bacterium]|nr:hypothetical protein [Planctomycetota bacterium]